MPIGATYRIVELMALGKFTNPVGGTHYRDFQGFLWEDIESFETRTYRPVLEYGGWGIRFGAGGKAYNVSGSRAFAPGSFF